VRIEWRGDGVTPRWSAKRSYFLPFFPPFFLAAFFFFGMRLTPFRVVERDLAGARRRSE